MSTPSQTHQSRMPERNGFLHGRFIEEEAVMTDMEEISQIKPSLTSRSAAPERKIPPLPKTRSLSDSGGTPVKLSPSPLILEANRKTSKDDSSIPSAPPSQTPGTPVTPRRPNVASYGAGLSIQMPPRDFTPPAPFGNSNPLLNPAPLSPKLEHSQIYASPTNLLPRRSRGLDFTRAATSLHHSTLAEQSSPESSPTIGGRRAMSISSRRGDFGGPEQTSTSLWSMMGSQEKMNASASLGSSNHAIVSDSSSSSDDDNLMDEDMDDAFVTTPQVNRMSSGLSGPNGTLSSPAMGSLMSFQNRQRYRKQNKKKLRGPMGQNRSPPNGIRSRRDSISWQANQLHISSRERDNEDGHKSDVDSPDGRGVIRRAVTRRGNMLPKPKTFARIRAALMEEGAPAEVETMREAEVIRQVRESDVEPDRRPPLPISETLAGDANTNGLPSPNLNDDLNDIPEDDMMADLANGLSGSFKPQPLLKSARGRAPWDNYSETGSIGGAESTPPPGAFLPRGSSSGISDDNGVESPAGMTAISHTMSQGSQPPSAADITRKINNKRRRDDDFDLHSFKRRAVSPSMSTHGSPVVQSPMQRDAAPWGSRPGSNGGEGRSSAASESGSTMGTTSCGQSAGPRVNGKGRIGFQGMVDTHDGIMRMSIE